MLAHVTGSLLAVLAIAAEPAAPPASPADSAPPSTPIAHVAFEGGVGGGVTSFEAGAPMLDGAVLVLLRDRFAVGVVVSAEPFGFSERQGAQTAGPPGSFRFSMPEMWLGLAGGVRGDLGGRLGELLLEVGAHPIWLAPEDWGDWDDDDLEVEGSTVLPYLGARGLVQIAGPFAVGAAVRADLMRRDLEATTREDGVEREWDVGRAGGVSAMGFLAVAFDIAFRRQP
jgi:hypothetical protein